MPLQKDLVGDLRPTILILLCGVALLFLVSCANAGNLVLARGASREKEIAIRNSLGASRTRLIRQLLAENFLLSLFGAGLGLGCAHYALRSLEVLLPAGLLPADGLHINARLIGFAIAVSIFCTLLFGLYPALRAVKVDLNDNFKEASRTFAGAAHAHLGRKALVVTQLALATILLVSAGLLLRSFDRLLAVSAGFRPDDVLSMQLSLPFAQYKGPAERSLFANRVLDRVRSLGGVRSAALISRLPLLPGGSHRSMEVKGRPSTADEPSPNYLVISPRYFETLGIALVAGRVFNEDDMRPEQRTVIVSAATAHRFWPNGEALGQYVKMEDRSDWSVVVGVVADVAQQALDRSPAPALYVPYGQDPWPASSLVLQTPLEPKQMATAVTVAVHQIDKDEAVYDIKTMEDAVLSSVHVRSFRTALLSLFALLALILASIGIYGVIAFTVAQRAHEIAIRLALGAHPVRLQAFVANEGIRLAAAGAIVGLLVSLPLMRLLTSILYGVQANDPRTFGATFLFLLLIAAVASYIPARRAARIDPAALFRVQ